MSLAEEQADKPIPPPTPPPPVRDQRDPGMLGSALLKIRQEWPDKPLSEMYDRHVGFLEVSIPEYDPEPVDHAAMRHAELRDRAAMGDKFAEALLRGESLAEEPTE